MRIVEIGFQNIQPTYIAECKVEQNDSFTGGTHYLRMPAFRNFWLPNGMTRQLDKVG